MYFTSVQKLQVSLTFLLSYAMAVMVASQPAQESYATKIYITKKDFYHFLGVFKHCPRAASVTCIPALLCHGSSQKPVSSGACSAQESYAT